ncbi:MAG: hypothetical protein QNJ84_12455 [Alphaproteobacteria bacterium]|nr:hypothetical protein [Alphaproteobacteria bacterium]
MAENALVDLYLPQLRAALEDVVGSDLADSLVKAAMQKGELTLDMQLAINDGVDLLDDAKRREVLAIIDDMRRRVRQES